MLVGTRKRRENTVSAATCIEILSGSFHLNRATLASSLVHMLLLVLLSPFLYCLLPDLPPIRGGSHLSVPERSADAVLLALTLPECHVTVLPGSPALAAMPCHLLEEMLLTTASQRSKISVLSCRADPKGCGSFEGERS